MYCSDGLFGATIEVGADDSIRSVLDAKKDIVGPGKSGDGGATKPTETFPVSSTPLFPVVTIGDKDGAGGTMLLKCCLVMTLDPSPAVCEYIKPCIS